MAETTSDTQNGCDERQFMELALELAVRGRGFVAPNPMVGAVIVRDGHVIGQGYHQRFGGPHAEIEALRAAAAAGQDVRGATMYVTLEPCCHHGKTPPCTEALLSAGLDKVVIAMEDPDSQVAGGGIGQLRQAGVDVCVGLCRSEARKLLAAYCKLRTTGRSWVIAKWAQTADGYLALPRGQGRWISGQASRDKAHALRGLCQGICVGIETVLADDPLLTNRSGQGSQPVRIIVDSQLRLPTDCQLLQTLDVSPVVLAATQTATQSQRAAKLQNAGAEVWALPASQDGVDLTALLEELGRRHMTYLLVEGGAKLLRSFLAANLVDEMWVFVSPKHVAGTEDLPRLDIAEWQGQHALTEPTEQRIDEDRLLQFILTD